MILRRRFLSLSFLSLVAVTGAQETASQTEFLPTPPKVELQDGDGFLFLGDSITHQALYTQYLETFFLTRYPDRKIMFWNSGVGGDRAADVLRRFNRDVAARKPTHVSVLLGMNDAGYTAWKQAVFETYVTDMTTVLDRLKETGAKITLMHPTLFDARAARLRGPSKEPTTSRYNAALAYYGEWCRETAAQRGLGFVDLHAPLARYTTEQRRKDPRFTFVPDAVHPDPNGHLIMAVTMLEEMFVDPGPVSEIRILKKPDGTPCFQANKGDLGQLEALPGGDGYQFQFAAQSLPWVVPDAASKAFELTRSREKFNVETLQVASLPEGTYTLKIDLQEVGQWSAQELAEGIDLSGNTKTPGYRLALEIAEKNANRNARHVARWRDWWAQKKIRELTIAQEASSAPADSARIGELVKAHELWMREEFEPGSKSALNESLADWIELREMVKRPRRSIYELRRVSDFEAKNAVP